MVIDNGHVGGALVGPAKDDAPWVVDPDRMKRSPSTLEAFQPVTGWNRYVLQPTRPIKLDKFAQRDSRNGAKAAVFLMPEELLGVFIGERAVHVAGGGIGERPERRGAPGSVIPTDQ